MEENIFRKFPNWARYLLAVPAGLVSVIIAYILMQISNAWIADPGSLYYIITGFVFKNSLNILVFFYVFNYTLPKYQFRITLALCIVLGIYYSMIMGISVFSMLVTWDFVVSFILVIASLIISCVVAYTQFKDNNKNAVLNKDETLKEDKNKTETIL